MNKQKQIFETDCTRGHTEDTKTKISESLTGRVLTDEHRAAISKSKAGANHPNWGKTRSEETRRKISEGQKGKVNPPWSEEAKERQSERVRLMWEKRKSQTK
jgi:hypothetical protein